METVKMNPERVKKAIEAAGGKIALSGRIDRHVRQIDNYLKGWPAPIHVVDLIEVVIREYERKTSGGRTKSKPAPRNDTGERG